MFRFVFVCLVPCLEELVSGWVFHLKKQYKDYGTIYHTKDVLDGIGTEITVTKKGVFSPLAVHHENFLKPLLSSLIKNLFLLS